MATHYAALRTVPPDGEAPRRRGFAGSRRAEALVDVAIARAAGAVVAADLSAVAFVRVAVLVELRSILDLLLRARDEDGLAVEIHVLDDAGRKHHFLPEDPGPRIDDKEASSDVVRGLVDLADTAVECFDGEARQVPLRHGCVAVRPQISR